VADAEFDAPLQHVVEVFGAVSVADLGVVEAYLSGLPAVAVHDDCDVPREVGGGELSVESPYIERVGRILQHLPHGVRLSGRLCRGVVPAQDRPAGGHAELDGRDLNGRSWPEVRGAGGVEQGDPVLPIVDRQDHRDLVKGALGVEDGGEHDEADRDG